jgi:hypothetical protein
VGISAKSIARLMSLMGGGVNVEDVDFVQLCRDLISRKNEEHAETFARTPYAARMVFLPQCLRCTAECQAHEEGAEHVCAECGACKAGDIVRRGGELGYLGVRILKGGSAVTRLVDELKPGAVVGVACHFEGALGILECERLGIPVQCVSLLRDGCADTDVDLDQVFALMDRKTDS